MFNKNTDTVAGILRKVYEKFHDNETDEVLSWGGSISIENLAKIWGKFSKDQDLSDFEKGHIAESEERIEWFEKTNNLNPESVLNTLIEISKKTIDHEGDIKKEGWFSKFRR
jgi:hypothetical protein